MSSESVVLEVDGLKKYFNQSSNIFESLLKRSSQPIKAVDDVSLTLESNEVMGVIGESGCGKTTLLRTLIGLYDSSDGTIRMRGQRVGSEMSWHDFRRKVQIIFQDPFNALNPRMTVEESLLEPLEVHDMDDRERRIRQTLRDVELSPPGKFLDQRPDNLSGGERQRVSIARALVIDPEIILADEPVSMLDVSTQTAILNLLSDLIDSKDVSMIYISHDLSTVAHICDEIHVMYLGRVIESAPTTALIDDPKHPYSQELINAIPIPDPDHDRTRTSLDSAVPSPEEVGSGCRFKSRCPERMDICDERPREIVTGNHTVTCHLYYDHAEESHEPSEKLGVGTQ